MLADNLFGRSFAASVGRFAEQGKGARLILAEVEDPAHLRHLGVPDIDESGRIVRIVEKPEDPPEHLLRHRRLPLRSAGRLRRHRHLQPSGRGELEITDVNNHYVAEGMIAYDITEGFWGDAGESIEAYYAVNDYVRRHGATSTEGPARISGLTDPDQTASKLSRRELRAPCNRACRPGVARPCPRTGRGGAP